MENIKHLDITDIPNSSFNIVLGKRRSGKSYMVRHSKEDG